MLALVAGSLLLFAQAQATIHNALPRYERRGTQLDNSTSYSNSSTSSSTSSIFTTTSVTTSMSCTSATSSSTTLSISYSSSSHISSTSSRSSSTSYINSILSNSTLSLPTEIPTKNTTSTPAPTCDSSTVTYQGSVPPTVYVTVTEGYTTTVTANSSYTSSDIYVTPLSACASTVVPLGSLQPLATIAVTIPVSGGSGAAGTATFTSPALGFASSSSLAGGGHPNANSDPGAPTEASTPAPGPSVNPHNPGLPAPESAGPGGAAGLSTVIYSTIYASAPSYTSTVTITKKTPAPVTVIPTSPPPNFEPSVVISTPDNTHVNTGGANNPTSGSSPSPKPVNSAAPQGPASVPAPHSAAPQSAAPAPAPALITLKPAPATEAPSPGNIIASLIGTPNVAPAPIVVPTATIGKSLGVAVLPSTVVIGTQFVPIPAESSETVVTENGVAYTVRPSEIVGPSTTLSIGSLRAHEQLASVTAAPQIVTAAPGVLVTVGASTAVVQGTTYRFGAGIPATTLTLSSGQKITINSFGVAMPSTTIAAASITHAPMVTETAGGLTFSMDGSQVVISGTTFRIGSGAHPLTTEFGGHTVSIGPGGVGFKSTTVKPIEATSVPKPGNGSGSGSGSGSGTGEDGAAATSSLVSQGAASTLLRLPAVQLLGCVLSALLFL